LTTVPSTVALEMNLLSKLSSGELLIDWTPPILGKPKWRKTQKRLAKKI